MVAMNILLLASHAVAEYDDLRMFTDLGYDCFAPGGYEIPSRSGEGIRPPLPDAPHHSEFVELCNQVRAENGDPRYAIDWAKAHIPDPIIDWADAIIVHHFPEVWIGLQWQRIAHKRVIWRTCGQSDPRLEATMADYVKRGLQVVRYSPRERIAFEKVGAFAGEDALIRFGKYPADYGPWDGNGFDVCDGATIGRSRDFEPIAIVGNVTQDMVARGNSVGLDFYRRSTLGLLAAPAGKGSEALPGGVGALSYEAMLAYLRYIRVYLYTGTKPAPYTLGLIEAMLSGVPVVSIGPKAWGDEWSGADLFEGHEFTRRGYDDPANARAYLALFLENDEYAIEESAVCRSQAEYYFDVAKVGQQWRAFLGAPVRDAVAA